MVKHSHTKAARWIALLSLAFLAASCATHSGWHRVWTEDFNGKEIDTKVWTRVGKGPSDWNDMMSLRPDLARVEDGQLVLLGIQNDHTTADTTAFLTGGVSSRHKKSFRMARVEIRAKFSSANGFWPALWLMPDTIMPAPDYAEIDLMEHLRADTFVYQTVHSHHTLHIDKKERHSVTAPIRRDDWNTYAAEIHPDSLCLFTNGRKTFTYRRRDGESYQFPWVNYPFYIILSNQLGGKWVGPVDKPEQLPTELRVDWIKVYQRKK